MGFAGQRCYQQLVSRVASALWDLLNPSSLLDPCWHLPGGTSAGFETLEEDCVGRLHFLEDGQCLRERLLGAAWG